MRNFIIAGLLGLGFGCLTGSASAQNPIGASGPYAPNAYNRNNQPLSPYLNLLRGTNSAVNYFYGVRPGSSGGGSPSAINTGSQGRQTFFPQIDTLYDLEDSKPGVGLPPTGHPFGFNNGLGYFGAGASSGARNQNQQAGMGVRRAMLRR